MSYHRSSFGDDDGLITSPSQVDPTLPSGPIMGTITNPNRVPCESLAPDDPWRKPGGPCAPQQSAADWVTGVVDKVKDAFSWLVPSGTTTTPTPTPAPTPTPTPDSPLPTLLLLAAAGGAAYYFTRNKKKVT